MARVLPLAMVVALLVVGCGEKERAPAAATPDPPKQPATPERAPALKPARCPAGAASCASATGRVIYVEKVDPDGDGDAHFVLFSKQSVTGRGLSVIDVRRALRPDPLPRIGDTVTAAGPVYTGSHGQRQIQATEVRVRAR